MVVATALECVFRALERRYTEGAVSWLQTYDMIQDLVRAAAVTA